MFYELKTPKATYASGIYKFESEEKIIESRLDVPDANYRKL